MGTLKIKIYHQKAVAIFGWADPEKRAHEGGGYNAIARLHIEHLQAQGHRVLYLQSGVHYSIWNYGPKIHIKRNELYLHAVLENSLVHAPALYQLGRETESVDADQNRMIIRWLQEEDVGAVFIHSLEGHSLPLFEALAKAGIPYSLFLHDHYTVCPRVSLLYQGRELCLNNDDGRRCRTCGTPQSDLRFRLRSAVYQSQSTALQLVNRLLLWLGEYRRRLNRATIHQSSLPRITLPNANRVFLDQSSATSKENPREQVMHSVLTHAEAVYAPSSFIIGYLRRFQLPVNTVQQIRIRLPHLQELREAARCMTGSTAKQLCFAFHGTAAPHKGGHIFIEAVRLLPASLRRRARFIVRGFQRDEIDGVEFYPPYDHSQLTDFIDEYTIGVAPHLWFENSPVAVLEHLAAGKPVIASELGGVTDFVIPGETGWLVPAGDAEALAALMHNIILGSEPIPQISLKDDYVPEEFFQELDPCLVGVCDEAQ